MFTVRVLSSTKLSLSHSFVIMASLDTGLPAWESDSFVDDNTLTVNITRLRKKLEAAGLVDFIITRKGLGYMV